MQNILKAEGKIILSASQMVNWERYLRKQPALEILLSDDLIRRRLETEELCSDEKNKPSILNVTVLFEFDTGNQIKKNLQNLDFQNLQDNFVNVAMAPINDPIPL